MFTNLHHKGMLNVYILILCNFIEAGIILCPQEPEDKWFYITHLSAEDMLKSAVIEEKKFNKLSTWAGADNPLGPNF